MPENPCIPTPDQPALDWIRHSPTELRAYPVRCPEIALFRITGMAETKNGATGCLTGSLIPANMATMPLLWNSPIHTLRRLAEEFLARFLSRMTETEEPVCHRCHGHGTVVKYPLQGGEESLPCPVCHPPVAPQEPAECECWTCKGKPGARGLHITFTLPAGR